MINFQDDVDFSDLALIEITKNIGGKMYVIREASGDAICKWRNAIGRAMKPGQDGKPSTYDGFADTDPFLISMCLFRLEGPKGAEKYLPVTTGEIRAWPNRVQKYLIEKVRLISELDQETEEELEKQIEELQKKLEEVREKGE